MSLRIAKPEADITLSSKSDETTKDDELSADSSRSEEAKFEGKGAKRSATGRIPL